MVDALHLKFRGFVRTYPRRYDTAPEGFANLSKIARGERAIIGRDEEVTIVFRSRDVSRRHCVIDGTTSIPFAIADLGSTSGTRLNGRPLKAPAPLSPGDEIGIGHVLLLVHEHPPVEEKRSIGQWANALDTGSRDRQWAAAEALASFGEEGSGAVASLIRAMDHEYAPVRRYAARALGLIGHERAVGALTKRLDETDALVAIEVVRALGRFEQRAAPAIASLVALMRDPRLQLAASRTLARIGEPAVVALREALHDDDTEILRLSVQALADIGEHAAASITELEALTRHEDPDVRRDVLRAIYKLGACTPTMAKALFTVIDKDDDERVRAWATSALGAAARNTRWEAKAVAELTRALDDPDIRFSAIVALGRLGPAARVAIVPLQRIADGARELYAKAAHEALEHIDPATSG